MSGAAIRIGTRGSALALAQARLVAEALALDGRRSRLVVVETEGDRRAADMAWGEGAFVADVERALLGRKVDVVVHSAKDVPTGEDPRLQIAAYLPRADPRDVLVVRGDWPAQSLDELPPGARVGTDSPRRVGFILARRPDLRPHPLHGNVDTRLRRLDEGETDALVLAAAGLDRLGRGARITQHFDPEVIPPAPGQGAIAVQVRRDDAPMLALTAPIDHPATRLAVTAERAFLAATGGGCRAPIGALAVSVDGEVVLFGGHTTPDGSATAFDRVRGPASDVMRLGVELAERLGIRVSTGTGSPLTAEPQASSARARILVTRAAGQATGFLGALAAAGLAGVHVPSISIEAVASGGDLDGAARSLDRYDWVVVTSANGAQAIVSAAEGVSTPLVAPRWAAIGVATRRVLEDAGFAVDLQPSRASGTAIAAELPVGPGSRVLLVRGDLADRDLPTVLRARGAEVDDVIAYRTVEAPATSRAALRDAMGAGRFAAVVFTSGSTVRGLVALASADSLDVTSIPAICIGPETAAAARRAAFHVLAEAPMRDAVTLAATTVAALAAQPQEIP